jgi:hypothetical protein
MSWERAAAEAATLNSRRIPKAFTLTVLPDAWIGLLVAAFKGIPSRIPVSSAF